MQHLQHTALKLILPLILVAGMCFTSTSFSSTQSLKKTAPQADPELREALINAVNRSDSFKDRFEAEVWLLDMSQRLARRVPDSKTRLDLLKNIHYEASQADLPPEMVLAVIEVESNGQYPWWAHGA